MIATALFALPLGFAVAVLVPPFGRHARGIAVGAGLMLALAAIASPAIPIRAGVHAAWAPPLGLTYSVDLDALSIMFIAVIGVVFAAGAASSERVGHARAYYSLLCVALAMLCGATVARDLWLFFAFWEAAIACLALLVAQWGSEGRLEAALRLVLTALIGSALYLIVIVSLAVVRGTLDVDVLRARPLPAAGQLVPAILLAIAFLVTLPMLPFHAWLIRAFTAAPSAAAILLSAALPSVALYALVRFCLGVFPHGIGSASPAFAALSAVGAIYGAVLAARQDDVRRVFAFASLSSINLAATGAFATTDLGVRGALLAAISRALIVCALLVLTTVIARRAGSPLLSRLGGLAGSSPLLASAMALAVFAALGIPGTSGFAADYLVLAGASERFPVVAGVAALALVASAVWGASLLRRAFHGPPLARGADLRWRDRAVVLPILVLIVAIGVVPRAITDRVPQDAIPAVESPR